MEIIDYRFFTERIPFFLFIFYLMRKDNKFDKVFKMHIYFIILFLPIFVFLYIYRINIFDFMHNYWDIEAPLEYAISIVMMYFYSMRRTKDVPYSVTLSYLLVSMTGYIYEIPRFYKLQGLIGLIRYSKYSLFYIDFQIVSILLVYSMLKDKGFTYNYRIFYSYIIYLIYLFAQLFTNIYVPEYNVTISIIDYVSFFYLGNWIYRIPALLLSFNLISGIKEKK